MTNEELKALALAATPSKWTTDGEKTVMSAESDQLNAGYAIFECHGPDALKNARFAAAANPAAVLGLITDNEQMHGECNDHMAVIGQKNEEIERLKAESFEEAFNTVCDERDALLAEVARLEDKTTLGVTLDGGLRVYGDWQSVRAAQEIIRERDALKAECEGLRKDAERLEKATAFVQQLCDAAGEQPSVATGYLHDILGAVSKEASNG